MSVRESVLIIDHAIHPAGIDQLRRDFEVRQVPHTAPEDELIAAGAECRGIFIRRGQVGRRLIEALPNLAIVVRHGVGYDTVDVKAATERGIAVGITPVNAVAVAEHVFAMLLSLTRRILDAQKSMRAGEWEPGTLLGTELDGKTIGIVGLGRVGSRVARIARGFGMTIIACDPYVQDNRFSDMAVERAALEDLLSAADIVSLHCWLSDDTRHMINAEAFRRMKRTAFLINASRGPVVDEAALIAALTDGRIAGAALDTFEEEPTDPDNPLRSLENVVLSPHIAGQAHEVMRRCSLAGAESISRELRGERPSNIVNPEAYDHR